MGQPNQQHKTVNCGTKGITVIKRNYNKMLGCVFN